MNNYAQRLKQYEAYKAECVRNGMSGNALAWALKEKSDKLRL